MKISIRDLATAIDDIAERIRALGKFSPGSFHQFSNLSEIKDAPAEPPPHQSMISILMEDNETISKLCADVGSFADENGDTATGDLMNGRMTYHDKTAWMLRSQLQ